jgi:hypothetical protein
VKVGQLSLRWTDAGNVFHMVVTSRQRRTAFLAHGLTAPIRVRVRSGQGSEERLAASVVVSANGQAEQFLVDLLTKEVLEPDDRPDGATVFEPESGDQRPHLPTGAGARLNEVSAEPVRDVFGALAEIREPLEALAQGHHRVIFQSKSTEQECDNDREIGWIQAIGGAVIAGLAVTTAGGSFAVQAVAMAAIGAVGGATAGKTDNDYKECMENTDDDDDLGRE